MTAPPADRTRMQLLLVAFLWGSALLLLFLSMRLRAKPLFMLGLADLLLAILVTALAVNRWKKDHNS